MMGATKVWSFETARLAVTAYFLPCEGLDLSWDEDGSTREGLETGHLEAFDTVIKVTLKDSDIELSCESLGESIYANPKDFITDHYTSPAIERNCSTMRELRGNRTVICHYFPDMVRAACEEARRALRSMQSLKVREVT